MSQFLMGLEKEFFCLSPEGAPVIVPSGVAADECGWLAEARGSAFGDITEAVYSLKASVHKLTLAAADEGVTLSDVPVMKLPREVRLKAARTFAKGTISYQSLYGFECHKNTLAEAVAGVHISFTCPDTISCGEHSRSYFKNFDWAQIFLKLDKAFAVEIKEAKRRPGFYELKCDGRIEYRSLPANVNLDKVITVVTNILDGKDIDEAVDEDEDCE